MISGGIDVNSLKLAKEIWRRSLTTIILSYHCHMKFQDRRKVTIFSRSHHWRTYKFSKLVCNVSGKVVNVWKATSRSIYLLMVIINCIMKKNWKVERSIELDQYHLKLPQWWLELQMVAKITTDYCDFLTMSLLLFDRMRHARKWFRWKSYKKVLKP